MENGNFLGKFQRWKEKKNGECGVGVGSSFTRKVG